MATESHRKQQDSGVSFPSMTLNISHCTFLLSTKKSLFFLNFIFLPESSVPKLVENVAPSVGDFSWKW